MFLLGIPNCTPDNTRGYVYAYQMTENRLPHDVPSLPGKEKHSILTDDYRSFATHPQSCVFQQHNISVGNHGFFLLLSAPRTSPPRACLRLEATVSLQHASLPSQHRSPGGMALIQTQRPKLTCPMPQK